MNDQQLRDSIKTVYEAKAWYTEGEYIPYWNQLEEAVIRRFDSVIPDVMPELKIQVDSDVFCHFTITSDKNASQVFEALKIIQNMARENEVEFNVE